jgi:single-strand DNA-binding protein
VVNFSLATTRKWKSSDGTPQEKTTWFRVAVFGKQAETCAQYLKKGRAALVEGEVGVSAYTDKKTGEAKASLELLANKVRFLPSGGGGETKDDMVQTPAQEEPPF